MNSADITQLAIKRHDIDASHFQHAYSEKENVLGKRELAFLRGRELVLDELALVLNCLPKGSRILDVGCGTAHLTHWIKEKGFDVCGIEPSAEMFNYARKNFPEIEIKQAISSKIPYEDNSFDLIVAFEVLRYLDKQENKKSFSEFHRILKPGGKFFVTQVNLFSTDLYFIFHNLKSVICKITHKTHHHCNFTTAGQQKKQIKNTGFSEVQTVGRFLGSSRIFYKFGRRPGNMYQSLIKNFSKNQRFKNSFRKNLTGHLIVIATK
ncbi:MAG: class I SAM-dependent methyltransferase [Ginsengibacter sp.]